MRYTVEEVGVWVEAIVQRDRRALSQAISLCERSDREGVRDAMMLLGALPEQQHETQMIAITGPPGVGKSSFIASIGALMVEEGRSLAVMSIDPSSSLSGGSIMGDKLRMAGLSGQGEVFIRPSPSAGAWGGLHPRSYEVRELLRAAGFDYLLVETVGVGQTEIEVRRLVDMVVLLLQPGSGDGVQMIKRGIHEWADMFVVNKADGDMRDLAERMRGQLKMTARIGHSLKEHEFVTLHSERDAALRQTCWKDIQARYHEVRTSRDLDTRRKEEQGYWLEKRITSLLLERLQRQSGVDFKALSDDGSTYTEVIRRFLNEMD